MSVCVCTICTMPALYCHYWCIWHVCLCVCVCVHNMHNACPVLPLLVHMACRCVCAQYAQCLPCTAIIGAYGMSVCVCVCVCTICTMPALYCHYWCIWHVCVCVHNMHNACPVLPLLVHMACLCVCAQYAQCLPCTAIIGAYGMSVCVCVCV